MNEDQYRASIRQMLYDAAHSREPTKDTQEHGWLNERSAHAVERIAADWPFTRHHMDRDEVLETIRSELSKTDNPLLRAVDMEKLADSVLRLEEIK